MEVKKGQNILEHEAEIYSRPARTWFQSSQDKQQSEGVSHFRIYLHTPTANIALSKRQYENNFQKDNSIIQRTPGSEAQTEKVWSRVIMKRACKLTPEPGSQSEISSPASLGGRRGGSLSQRGKQKKIEKLLMRPYALRRKLLVQPRLVLQTNQLPGKGNPSTRGRVTN